MNVELTKEEVLELNDGIKALSKVKADPRFSYGVSKNKRIIRDEVESLEETIKPSDDFVEYEKERVKLVESLAKRDDKGSPRIIRVPVVGKSGEQSFDTRYDVDENDPKFKSELKKLKSKYKDSIDTQKEKESTFEKMLKEKITLDLYGIQLDLVPDIEEGIFDKIFPIILMPE